MYSHYFAVLITMHYAKGGMSVEGVTYPLGGFDFGPNLADGQEGVASMGEKQRSHCS